MNPNCFFMVLNEQQKLYMIISYQRLSSTYYKPWTLFMRRILTVSILEIHILHSVINLLPVWCVSGILGLLLFTTYNLSVAEIPVNNQKTVSLFLCLSLTMFIVENRGCCIHILCYKSFAFFWWELLHFDRNCKWKTPDCTKPTKLHTEPHSEATHTACYTAVLHYAATCWIIWLSSIFVFA